MIVVDASVLYEVLIDSPRAEALRQRLAEDTDHAAPHIIDVEVFGLLQRDNLEGRLDDTLAALAVEDLRSWPGERYSHRRLLERVWELRRNVRGWDATYVALAEALGATLVTLDQRLADAPGPTCPIEVPRG